MAKKSTNRTLRDALSGFSAPKAVSRASRDRFYKAHSTYVAGQHASIRDRVTADLSRLVVRERLGQAGTRAGNDGQLLLASGAKRAVSRAGGAPPATNRLLSDVGSRAFALGYDFPRYSGPLPLECPPGFSPFAWIVPPYTMGTPTPEHKVPVNANWGDPNSGAKYHSISELAVPEEGLLSLGCLAGNFYFEGTRGRNSYPATGNWLFGDMISCSASLTHVLHLGNFVRSAGVLRVSAHSWIASREVNQLIYCFPGPYGSFGDGLIATIGYLTLTVYPKPRDWRAYTPGSLQPSATSQMFLKTFAFSDTNNWAVYPEGQIFTYLTGEQEVSVDLPVHPGLESVVIDVTVQIDGLINGVNDPQSGMAGIALQDRNRASQIMRDPYWMHPVPLEVFLLKACLKA